MCAGGGGRGRAALSCSQARSRAGSPLADGLLTANAQSHKDKWAGMVRLRGVCSRQTGRPGHRVGAGKPHSCRSSSRWWVRVPGWLLLPMPRPAPPPPSPRQRSRPTAVSPALTSSPLCWAPPNHAPRPSALAHPHPLAPACMHGMRTDGHTHDHMRERAPPRRTTTAPKPPIPMPPRHPFPPCCSPPLRTTTPTPTTRSSR